MYSTNLIYQVMKPKFHTFESQFNTPTGCNPLFLRSFHEFSACLVWQRQARIVQWQLPETSFTYY